MRRMKNKKPFTAFFFFGFIPGPTSSPLSEIECQEQHRTCGSDQPRRGQHQQRIGKGRIEIDHGDHRIHQGVSEEEPPRPPAYPLFLQCEESQQGGQSQRYVSQRIHIPEEQMRGLVEDADRLPIPAQRIGNHRRQLDNVIEGDISGVHDREQERHMREEFLLLGNRIVEREHCDEQRNRNEKREAVDRDRIPRELEDSRHLHQLHDAVERARDRSSKRRPESDSVDVVGHIFV